MTLTYDEVVAVLGPVDRPFAARIAATGATASELTEAWAWVGGEDAMMSEGRPLPSGRVAELVELLQPEEEDDDGR